MNRRGLEIRSTAAWIVAAVVAGLVPVRSASAQEAASREGGPVLLNQAQRSGLITRQMPIIPQLPHDPDRDDFYQTRRAHRPVTRPNWLGTGGLYGLPLKGDCTVSIAPYFTGTPGGTYGPNCEKVKFRYVGNFINPWRPVYQYYSGGSYTPVYDLDPWAPGPGPFPLSHLYHRQPMGS